MMTETADDLNIGASLKASFDRDGITVSDELINRTLMAIEAAKDNADSYALGDTEAKRREGRTAFTRVAGIAAAVVIGAVGISVAVASSGSSAKSEAENMMAYDMSMPEEGTYSLDVNKKSASAEAPAEEGAMIYDGIVALAAPTFTENCDEDVLEDSIWESAAPECAEADTGYPAAAEERKAEKEAEGTDGKFLMSNACTGAAAGNGAESERAAENVTAEDLRTAERIRELWLAANALAWEESDESLIKAIVTGADEVSFTMVICIEGNESEPIEKLTYFREKMTATDSSGVIISLEN